MMGICISCDETAPIPRPTCVAFRCDAPGCSGHFAYVTNFVDAYAMAMRAGWLERRDDGARRFLCPGCSGKRRAA